MKIGFLHTHNLWPSHYETELELIQNQLDAGHEVHQFVCFKELQACDQNLNGDLFKCFNCLHRHKQGILQLDNSKNLRIVRLERILDNQQMEWEFNSLGDLKALTYDNYDIGQSVASSLISELRNSSLDVETYKDLINKYLNDALALYIGLRTYLQKNGFDSIYVFNGRFAHNRACLRACQFLEIDCFIHERGHNTKHYVEYKNHLPHSIGDFKLNAINAWKNDTICQERADKFYNSRRNGEAVSWYSFVDKQKKDLIPENWDSSLKNIVIFNSSEDEMAAIGEEWINEIYPNQITAIKLLERDLSDQANVQIYLRLHPNLKSAPDEVNGYREMAENSSIKIIWPESEVSSYALMEMSDVVVTFGSTMGVEATYWGKPSVLLGKSFYLNLDVSYVPENHLQAIEILKTDLIPKNTEGTLIYGNYLMSFGKPFKYADATSFEDVSFKGLQLPRKHINFFIRQIRLRPKVRKLTTWLINKFDILYKVYK